MRYFIALQIMWYINAIFSHRGYDRYIDMILQLVIPGIIATIIIAMFAHVFIQKYIKNRFIFALILSILITITFRVNDSYHSRKFQENYKKYEQLARLISKNKQSLPIRVSPDSILEDIELTYYSNKLIYTYLVKGDNKIVNENKFIQSVEKSKSVMIKEVCSQEIIKILFTKRIVVEYQYKNIQNKKLFTLKINPKVCFG